MWGKIAVILLALSLLQPAKARINSERLVQTQTIDKEHSRNTVGDQDLDKSDENEIIRSELDRKLQHDMDDLHKEAELMKSLNDKFNPLSDGRIHKLQSEFAEALHFQSLFGRLAMARGKK